jgi:hypothetical protein
MPPLHEEAMPDGQAASLATLLQLGTDTGGIEGELPPQAAAVTRAARDAAANSRCIQRR